ncbi:hypothetical protein CB0940_12200 [Cercospora beticola]|uniref:Uncharacterized protein n=1 Tax=Cercospora beticola TaxID=122368 RepID=A0A2G5GRS9_CERBT|nr:hypothetical protein CB0940_12200 [Cercospora beticola]PIA82970.1 hypothetical protein CB0940_12200 [Cercospora beticola]
MDLMNGLPKTTASSATPRRRTVNFLTENSVKYIEGFSGPIMSKQVFETFDRNEITDSMLVEAVSLFNENYGVWGTHPIGSYPTPKQGGSRKHYFEGMANLVNRKPREAEQRPPASPIFTRKRRLLVCEGYNRRSPGRECLCLPMEIREKNNLLDYSTSCARRLPRAWARGQLAELCAPR